MASLARMYADGLGTPQGLQEAVRLYEKAARTGEFFAQIELARIYARGLGVPVDGAVALRWYSAACQEANVADCEELREARAYLANRAGKPAS